MTFFYVLGKFRFVVCELIVSVMFSETHVERSSSLSNILFVACLARQLICSILVKFVWFLGFLHFQKFSQVIDSGICHFQRCVSEEFCDVSSFSSDVCELDPSLVLVFLFVSLSLFCVFAESIQEQSVVFVVVNDLLHNISFFLFLLVVKVVGMNPIRKGSDGCELLFHWMA